MKTRLRLINGAGFFYRFLCGLSYVLGLGFFTPPLLSQGTFPTIHTTLETGSGTALTTPVQTFVADSLQPLYQLRFAFGFATEEQPGPERFFDSVTVTLRTFDGVATAVYLTVDRNGPVWAPLTPGTVVLNPADIMATVLDYQDTSHSWTHQVAYWVQAPVPAQFAGTQVNLYLDLFDNGDSFRSLAWISAVPEPGCVVLGLLGGLVWLLRARSRC
jgi:hypothetical protein